MTVVSDVPATSQMASQVSNNGNVGVGVDYNSFLKLLVTQVQHQDPLDPQDPTAYMSQLATFSNLEQQIQSNTKLGSILTMLQNTDVADAVRYLGHEIQTANGQWQMVRGVEMVNGQLVLNLADNSQAYVSDIASVRVLEPITQDISTMV